MARDAGDMACGPHAVEAAAQSGRATKILLSRTLRSGKALRSAEIAAKAGILVERVDPAALEKAAGGAAAQGIVALCAPAEESGNWKPFLAALPEGERIVLMLDGVEDPRNFGACLRSAWAFGADCVIAPRRGSAPLSAVARKAAAGAAESLRVFRCGSFGHVVKELRRMGFAVVTASEDARESIWDADLGGDIAWLLGGEGKGVRKSLEGKSDLAVRIPMEPGVDSLNVSVATGVCLAVTTRQRR